MGSLQSTFTIKAEPIENSRPMKVRVIGAGYSGIYLGVRIPQRLRNVELRIYEKNEGVGGTWWENRYPGCACDVPAHSYQYLFEPNKTWSEFYASAPEIRGYLGSVAERYGAMRYIKTGHKVLSCIWNENVTKWHLSVQELSTGKIFEDEADIVVSCRGILNDPKWPQIAGLQKFGGKLMHSAAWEDGVDFRNKRVGLIGAGSSGVQILPELRKIEGTSVSLFVRSPTFIANPFFDETMKSMGLDPKVLTFSDEQKSQFVKDAAAYLNFRKTLEGFAVGTHSLTIKDSSMQKEFVETLRALMKEKLSKRPDICTALTPSYAAGCRRLIPGPGYLEALVQENVSFYNDKILCVNQQGIELDDGNKVDLDIIVCATGFDSSCVPPFEVRGRKGKTLQDRFLPYPETYMSLAVDGFPNFFFMMGPNSALGAGSLTVVLEAQGDYIVKCIRKMQKEDYLTMEPKRDRVSDFSELIDEYFKNTVYTDHCHSWYKNENGKGDRIIGLWPGSTTHALEMLRAPRWEDYEYISIDKNRLRWLGNGMSVCQLGEADPTWYLNPEFVESAHTEQPEVDSKYKLRPFSH